MSLRIAAAMSLLAFAVCLLAGIGADNPFATTLTRALVAMGGTVVVGLIVGAMAQKMLDEHQAAREAAEAARAAPPAEESGKDAPPVTGPRSGERRWTEQGAGRGMKKNPVGREIV